jgi:hypothetical protein
VSQSLPAAAHEDSLRTRTDAEPLTSGLSVIFGAAALAVAGQLFMNVYPVFIGALTDAGRATPSQLGLLTSIEYFCVAWPAMFAGKLLPLTRLRTWAVAAALVELAAVAATTHVSGNQFLPVRAVYASACGIHVWILYEFVARSRNPGRMVGICTTVVAVTGMLMSWLGSRYVLPVLGVNALIVFFGLPSLVAILGAWILPRQVATSPADPQTNTPAVKATLSLSAVCFLISVLTWSAWIDILWIYSEPLAKSIGIAQTASQASPVVALGSSLVGAALGALLSEHLPYGRVLTVGLLVCLAQVSTFLFGSVGSTAYVVWFSAFGFLGYFLIPFFVKGLVATDPSRQSVVWFPAAQYAGPTFGSLIASFFVSPGQYRGGLLVDLGGVTLAICSLWIGMLCRRSIR